MGWCPGGRRCQQPPWRTGLRSQPEQTGPVETRVAIGMDVHVDAVSVVARHPVRQVRKPSLGQAVMARRGRREGMVLASFDSHTARGQCSTGFLQGYRGREGPLGGASQLPA